MSSKVKKQVFSRDVEDKLSDLLDKDDALVLSDGGLDAVTLRLNVMALKLLYRGTSELSASEVALLLLFAAEEVEDGYVAEKVADTVTEEDLTILLRDPEPN